MHPMICFALQKLAAISCLYLFTVYLVSKLQI